MFLHRLLITDIGPFGGQTRQIVYRVGNTLVKAPIGSGKSFLYFDAPLYALYKYAPRNLVNIKSKTGTIVAIVECDHQIYLIHRALKKGSVKDGCTSQLYKRSDSVSSFLALHETWTIDTTLQTMMAHPSREQLLFKNESDLQQTREHLLPPREVFTSTHMLTQDADHIFQMQPAQRVEVFKHLFDLMGIDDAKDILMDHHRGLKHKITIMSDTSRVDQQCRQELGQIRDLFGRLGISSRQALSWLSAEIERYQPLLGSLSLQQYSRDDQIDGQIVSLIEQLQLQHADYLTMQTTLSLYQQQLSDLDQTKQKLTTVMHTNTQRLSQIQSAGGQDLSPQLKNLKDESQTLLLTIQQCQNALPVSTIQQWLEKHQEALGLTMTVSDWSGLESLLTVLIQQGRHLADQCATLEQSKHQATAQATQLIETKRQSHLQTIQQLEQEQLSLQQRLEQLTAQSQRLDQDISLALQFDCEKIQGLCPFVEKINTSSVQAIKQQRDTLTAQIADLQSQITTRDISTRISQEQSSLAQLTASGATPPSLTSIEESIQRLQSQQQLIKQFLMEIQWKQLQADIQIIKEHLERARQLGVQIQSLQSQVDQQAALIQEQATLQALIQEHTQQLTQLNVQHNDLTTQYATVRDKIASLSGTTITQDLSALQSIQQHISALRRLITSYQDDKLLLQQTKEQEEIVSELVKIFAKDLMREVVRTSLPLIQEAINSYLSQVVDYELSLDLKETSSGNLELDAIVTDHRGSREVKSLSGGQKVILKLAWIMAVSSFLRVRFLFLDETINNLDQETTALVSRLFESFVKKQQIAFVCITHSLEIQQINIWDEVVVV